jgi:OHCU decarboxylase
MTSPGTMDKSTFMQRFGAVWEHSPWIAEATFDAGLPAGKVDAGSLHAAMCRVMRAGQSDRIRHLVMAHPDLAGRLALAKGLTRESTAEQSSAGLNQLTVIEQQNFLDLNEQYKARFGFPFIVAVAGLSKGDILQQFHLRLKNTQSEEWNEALRQIELIALYRIRQIMGSQGGTVA